MTLLSFINPSLTLNKSKLLLIFLLPFCHFINAQSFIWASKATSSSNDNAADVTVDNMGNYYSVGKFAGTINFDSAGFTKSITSAGLADIYVAKFNCSRNLVWSNRIGGTLNEAGAINGISIDYDNKGNIYVTGTFAGSATFTTKSGSSQVLVSSGDNDAFLAKYDTLGVLQWVIKAGGIASDEGINVVVDYTGNIIITGYFTDNATWGTTSGATLSLTLGLLGDVFIAKYNPLGQPIWVSKASSPLQDLGLTVAVDKQNNIYACGNFACCSGGTISFGSHSLANTSGWGAFLAKMDSTGVWEWVNGLGGSAWEGGAACVADDSGNVFFSGHFDASSSISSSPPGMAISLTNNGNNDVFIAKYNSSGVLDWAKSFGGTGYDINQDIGINGTHNIVITGHFSSSCNFNGITLTSSGGTDTYLAEYTKAGNIVQCIKGGGTGDDGGSRLKVDSKGRIYVAGGFTSVANFGATSLTGLGGSESFITKISLGPSFSLIQNPTTSPCTGDSVMLTGETPLPTNSIFKWLRNGIIIPSATNDSLYTKTSGSYQLIVTNNCNESDTSQAVVVNFTSPLITPISDVTICQGDSIQLTATGGTSYSWDPTTGLSNPNIANPYAKPTSNQQYIVTISNGVCGTKDTVMVTVNTNCCFSCSTPAAINGNLVACYPFNGNANDESGNNNHGTTVGAILTTDRNGAPNKAMYFNGSSYINVPNSLSLQSPSTAITLSTWIYIDSWYFLGGTNYAPILCKSSAASSTQYRFTVTPNSMDLIFAGSQKINTLATSFSLNTWYHVVATSASGVVKFYINGVLVPGTNATGTFPANSASAMDIGRDLAGSTDFFTGKIDDIRIYNRALTASEIGDLYIGTEPPIVTPLTDKTICQGDSIQLIANGGVSYTWSPSIGLSNPSIANPYAKPTSTQEYIVTISSGSCSTKDTVIVNVSINCCATCTTATSLNNNLVACYPFTGNTTDATGNGHDGTVIGGATLTNDRFGNANSAYSLNGTTSAITIPHHSDFNFSPTGQFSISLWAKPGSANQIAGLFVKSPFHANIGLSIWNYGLYQIVNKAMGGYAFNVAVQSTTSFLANTTWYHLVITYNNGRWECYVNGTLEAFDYSQTKFISQSTGGISIGKKGEANGDYYNGLVDDIRIYSRALSPLDVSELYVLKPTRLPTLTQKTICQGDSTQLSAIGGTSYTWTPSTGLSNPNISNPYAKPADTTTYLVTIFTGTCYSSDTVKVNVKKITVDAGANQTICFRDSIQLQATGSVGATYAWTPSSSLNNASIANPYAKPSDTTLYKVTATLNGCSAKDSVTINVKKVLADAGANAPICIGDSIQLNATGGTSYAWKQHISLSDSTLQNPYAKPTDTTKYFVTVKNGLCSNIDSVTIFVATPANFNAGTDKIICLGDSVQLTATGGTTYLWSVSSSLSNVNIANPYAKPSDTTKYYVTISNSLCSTIDSVTVNVKKVVVDAGISQNICFRDSIQLQAVGSVGASYTWTPSASLNNASIANPYAKPSDTTLYKVTATLNGCSAKDSVTINVKKVPADAGANVTICINDSVQLNATGGTSYAWKQNTTLSDTAIQNPFAKPAITTKYFVTVKDGLCSNTDSVTITIATSISLNAGVDTSVCLGDSIRLLATGATSYTWSAASTLSNIAIANPYAKPSDTTMYYVTGFSGSCSATDSVKVSVKKPIIDAGLTQTICYGDSIQLHATGSLGSTYTWTPIISLSNPSIANPYAKPSDTTMYHVTGLSNGCTARDSVKINVRRVIADAGPNTSTCLGDSVRLNATGGTSFTWQANPTLSSTGIHNPYAKPIANTTYHVTVNDGTCNARDSVTVTLNNTNTLNAGLDTEVCLNDSVQLQANGATTYTWTPAIGLSSTSIANPKASPTIPTDYIVRGLAGLCYDTDTIRVNIKQLPIVDLGIDTFVCNNESYTFYPSVSNADEYSWEPAALLDDPAALNPTTTLNSAQTFTLTATNSITGCVNSDQIVVSIQKPTARFTLDDTASSVPPLIVTPNNTSYPLPLLYNWEMLDTIPAYYTDAEPTHSFNEVGTYKILLTVTDERGCTDTTSKFVSVSNEAKIFIPNVFTPNGNGLNDVFEISFIPGTILEMKGSIWNRWGGKIYEFGSPSYIWWNGQIDSQDGSDGVYYYIVDIIDLKGKPQQFHGTVTLLR